MTFVAGVEGSILRRGNFFFIALIESAVKECFINCEQRAAISKLEGNVLINLRPAMFQMLMGTNVHDVQMSMMSKYP